MRKHKWWHFVYGKKSAWETVFKDSNIETTNHWDECKKCGEQLTEKQGCTTFRITIDTKNK